MKRLLCFLLAAALTGPALAGHRFPDIEPAQMTPEQKAIMDAIASGPRKSGAGPFQAWLRSPALADRLQKVGEYVRFQSSLPKRLSEFTILLTGRYWNSQFEWAYHYPLGLKAGVSEAVLADIAAQRTPTGMSEDESLVYAVASELRTTKIVSDATYARAMSRFGERGIIDLIAASGYYDIVCMTLNVAEVPVPADSKGAAARDRSSAQTLTGHVKCWKL